MTWNYRIIKKTFADNDAAQYEIHEVYYEGNSISGWTESSVNPSGASVAELRAFVASEYIYQFLGSHPLIKKEEKLKHLYEKAALALAELYQDAGRLEFEKS